MKPVNASEAPPLGIIRIDTTPDFASIVETGLEHIGILCSCWIQDEPPAARIEIYCDSPADAAARQVMLADHLATWADGERWTIEAVELPAQDWKESWKRFFRTERVSERIVIKPSWERFDPAPGDCVIELDPGMSFGTGQHGTTRACLQFIDTLARAMPGASLLDAGCGSGILSIAAARLGMHPVTAIDNDPAAIRIADDNIARSGVADRVTRQVLSVAELGTLAPHDIVVANILADVLRADAATIAGAVRAPDGRLILSGLLTSQYDGLRAVYESLGFAEERRVAINEWTSGLFRRRGAFGLG